LYFEKAFAKLLNGYYNMSKVNDPELGFTCLTGAPSSSFSTSDFRDENELWRFITDRKAEGDLICFRVCDWNTANMLRTKDYE
jgi:hypothetical protein